MFTFYYIYVLRYHSLCNCNSFLSCFFFSKLIKEMSTLHVNMRDMFITTSTARRTMPHDPETKGFIDSLSQYSSFAGTKDTKIDIIYRLHRTGIDSRACPLPGGGGYGGWRVEVWGWERGCEEGEI